MGWVRCAGQSGTELIPLDLTNEVHNIQNNRTITISRNTIVSPISSWTDCIGIIAIPLDLSDGSNTIVIKYDLQGYSKTETVYYSTMFFDDNNSVNNVAQKTGAYPYGYKQLYQAEIASGGDDDLGHIDCLGVLPNISGTLYLKINFGTTNYKSLSLFKTKL